MERQNERSLKLIVIVVTLLVVIAGVIIATNILSSKEMYYFQIDESATWIVDKTQIEDKAFTDIIHYKGIIYNGTHKFTIDNYNIHLYLKYQDSTKGVFDLINSSASVEGGVYNIVDGYNIGSVGYQSLSEFSADGLDMSKAYLEVSYILEDVQMTDTVEIAISGEGVGNNELASAFSKVTYPNIVSAHSNSLTDLFYLGMTIEETEEILEKFEIYNTGITDFKDGTQFISIGRLSELFLLFNEVGEVEIIQVMGEISTEKGISFDSRLSEVIECYGNNYEEINDDNLTRMIEYQIGNHFVSFTFTDDELEIWNVSNEAFIEQ